MSTQVNIFAPNLEELWGFGNEATEYLKHKHEAKTAGPKYKKGPRLHN